MSAAVARIHATAIVEPGVEIGAGSAVWDHAHIRGPARLGVDCIVGGKSYIASKRRHTAEAFWNRPPTAAEQSSVPLPEFPETEPRPGSPPFRY